MSSHPATEAAWRWLNSRGPDEMGGDRRERIVRTLTALDADLHALDAATEPKCSGYCVGTASAATFVEDLACPVHGIEAQERAKQVYPDRQAWLDAISPSNSQPRPEE